MDYTEHYIIRYRFWDSVNDREGAGEFGPYPCEEDALQQMRKIQNKHDHVKSIFWAHMYRLSEVMLASYARARKQP